MDMKLLVISSSIFYFLGLKMTDNIEISKEIKTDSISVHIQVPANVIVPDIREEKSFDMLKNENESEENKWSNFFFEPTPAPNEFIEKID